MTVAPTLASAAPGGAPRSEPSVSDVQKQLGDLALANTQLVEQYNQAKIVVTQREAAARGAQATALKANAAYSQAHQQFVEIIQSQYEGGDSFGAAGALLDSSSGTNYLDRIDLMNMVSTRNAQVIKSLGQARTAAASAATTAQNLLVAARQQSSALNAKRTEVQAQIRKYQQLLSTLTSAQQAAYQRSLSPAASQQQVTAVQQTVSAGTGAAAIAVKFALAQVGKPYVFGAGGPGAYDCSGLTMASWAAAGVSLPHSAADQYNYGTHVAENALQPGDLIFFYQPIGHVTIYIGDGLMVSAPTEGEPVAVVPLAYFQGDYVGATRL
ncbi:MAG: C40 family peptidase [Actinobacteria bacterium]|nr:C40 family peptidase [Actinomycetota bacterium]